MYQIYAIRAEKTGRIYVGMSQNIEKRVKEYNSGQVFSTKGFRPWKLVFSENCGDDRKYTRSREKYWKSGVGKQNLKKIIPE